MNYFLLGIKGVAMANIAVMLKQQGHNVTGADVAEVFPTDVALIDNNIQFDVFHVTALPENIDRLVYSAAHGGKHNPLIKQAEEKGILLLHQAELLGEVLTHFNTSIAVAGCHGKTTTSSLLSYALIQLDQKPSYMVGTPSFSGQPGSAFNGKDYFVIEADEYGLNPPDNTTPKFHYLKPDYAIVTNIDFDHPDVFKNLEQTKQAFRTFMDDVVKKNSQQLLVICADDTSLMDTVNDYSKGNYITYGLSEKADYQVANMSFHEERTQFELLYEGTSLGMFSTKLAGEKNATNTAGVIAMLIKLGFSADDIRIAISDFSGAKRRFEKIAEKNGIDIFDDYAHHPHELEAVISGAKAKFPHRKLIVLFQPHTFSRTEMLKEEFVTALSLADTSIIIPIFASAREEKSETSITSKDLGELATSKGLRNIFGVSSETEAVEILKNHLQPGDVVLFAGAGDIYKLKNDIIDIC
jgi:UDP-N-acetylmuramate--alanine ligase